jgi:hypothetical protein
MLETGIKKILHTLHEGAQAIQLQLVDHLGTLFVGSDNSQVAQNA